MLLSDGVVLIQPQELACYVVQRDDLNRHPGGITLFSSAPGLRVSNQASDEKVTVGRKDADRSSRSHIRFMDKCQGGKGSADQWGVSMPMNDMMRPATCVEEHRPWHIKGEVWAPDELLVDAKRFFTESSQPNHPIRYRPEDE